MTSAIPSDDRVTLAPGGAHGIMVAATRPDGCTHGRTGATARRIRRVHDVGYRVASGRRSLPSIAAPTGRGAADRLAGVVSTVTILLQPVFLTEYIAESA